MTDTKQLIGNQQEQGEEKMAWMSEAYADFIDRITDKYLISHEIATMKDFRESDKTHLIEPNSSAQEQDFLKCFCCALSPLVIPFIWLNTRNFLNIEQNSFAFVVSEEDGAKKTKIYGPGQHIIGYYNKVQGKYSFANRQIYDRPIISEIGDLMIACVEQGKILHLEQSGHNILLGPGIHVIDEPMIYIRQYSLDQFFIQIGPEKWVTVPDGYDGIAVNRGMIRVLKGGKQHHLTHAGEKFVKLVPKTLQTDRVPTDIPQYVAQILSGQITQRRNHEDLTEYLKTTTQEGSTVFLDAMIFWNIVETEIAAKRAMEILKIDDNQRDDVVISQSESIKAASKHISTLRTTVLRLAKLHLTALVGTTSMGGSAQSMQTGIQGNVPKDMQLTKNEDLIKQNQEQVSNFEDQKKQEEHNFQILNFLQSQSATLKDLINADLKDIGVRLQNICIYSVTPTNEIQKELDSQTKARVDANTALIRVNADRMASQVKIETDNELALLKANANAKVTKTIAEAQAMADVIKAKGTADSIIKVAEARRKEAEELEQRQISQDLATIRETGTAGQKIFTGGSNNFVFGQSPSEVMNGMFQQQQMTQMKYMQKK